VTMPDSPQRPAHGRQRRSAFTLVEILTVISILLILLAISVYGLKHMLRSQKDRATNTALETAQAMVAELQATGGTSRLAAVVAIYYPNTNTSTATSPGVVVDGASERLPANDSMGAVAATQAILNVLLNNPNNQAMFDKLPAQRKLYVPTPNGSANEPLLLDGYGNPIIYVPPPGLTGVGIGLGGYSSGTPTFDQPNLTIQSSPSAPRAFFASAGEDGNFTTGDDNVYSFNK